jgi:hypothetical protein
MDKELFLIQTKRFLSDWETMRHYFFTNSKGDISKVKGFPNFQQAKDWAFDRFPDKNLLNSERDINFNYN